MAQFLSTTIQVSQKLGHWDFVYSALVKQGRVMHVKNIKPDFPEVGGITNNIQNGNYRLCSPKTQGVNQLT